MKKTEYAIVDIETTGGNANGSRITEIAIIIHDGEQVLDRYETLINPQKNIPMAIFALTGITNEMVSTAPIFDDVSNEIYDLLNGRVFVAHNVNFDYSFVHHELARAGLKWTARKLCTVRAARKIKPGLPSYSLGKLCHSLDIILENRHRAGGDADATAILFSKLMHWDTEGVLNLMIKNTSQDQRLPPNLPPADFEQLPSKPGVYYFYNQENKVIYVGKAINIQKRVASHFTGNSTTAQRQNFLKDIYNISFEVCGNELIALLLECTEIKKLWPQYNRALKKYEAKYGIFTYEARNGYKYLAVGKLGKFQHSIKDCNNQFEGINMLSKLSSMFSIDMRFCYFAAVNEGEHLAPKNKEELPDIESHNAKVDAAIFHLTEEQPSFAIIDSGRLNNERSCIWVENGSFYGMGYINIDETDIDADTVKESVTRYNSNPYIMQLIYSYAKNNSRKVYFKQHVNQLDEVLV